MVNVSIIKIFYSVLILMKCKRSVDLFILSSNKFVLIRNSSIFVDKTVLLKRIFQYDFLLITAPHKFGKTTNLHMIKMFLGNNNPKNVVADVFRNTNIWRDREFIVKHVGNYPVIHCSMKAKEAIQTYDDLRRELKTAVSNTFLEHKYLLQSTKLGLATKRRYIEYCKSQVNDYEIGLKFLSKILHMHHGKRATVLIDDFDYGLTYSIFKRELDSSKTAELLFRLIDNTINLNEYVEKSVVVGCVPFKLGAQYSGLYLLEHFKFMVTKDFTPYFGFTQRETESLLDKFQLGKFKKDILKWYGGYSYLYSDFPMYNPWSVLMFLKNRKFDIYWVAKSSQRMLYTYLEPNYVLKEHLSNLVKNKNVTIEAVSSFTSYEVDKLKDVQFASYSYAEDYTEDHLFLQLLLESGYLTYAQKYRTVPISTKVKIPNFEIQKVFEQIVMRLAAVYPDINRMYRAYPTRHYKPHREPIQSPRQDFKRRPSNNQLTSFGRRPQYPQRGSSIYGTRRSSYPYRSYGTYKSIYSTYSKYTRRPLFHNKFTSNRGSESAELKYSIDESRIHKTVNMPLKDNTVHQRLNSDQKGRLFEKSISGRYSVKSNSRLYGKTPPNRSDNQHYNPQREDSSESSNSDSASFFANYRAHLRARKIKATPDLIFNPQYKTERESSSLEFPVSEIDSFTYNYKTFEEAERLNRLVTHKQQLKNDMQSNLFESHYLQRSWNIHQQMPHKSTTNSMKMKLTTQKSNTEKVFYSLEQMPDKSTTHMNKEMKSTTQRSKTQRELYSLESQNIHRSLLYRDSKFSKGRPESKVSTSVSSTHESEEVLFSESLDLDSDSLEFMSSVDEHSRSVIPTEPYTTHSPNSFIDCFAHSLMPSTNHQLILAKNSSQISFVQEQITSKTKPTDLVHTTIDSHTPLINNSLAVIHHFITETPQTYNNTK